ncbi:MAG: acyltransferase domain-containing protein [Cyanothece sp. SIO2G6]|nr:acyltransferase domain-containing protein [Cyanothece sp. SIO2G6]
MTITNSPQGIAVIGMACRFPGARNYEEFWANLENGMNSITEIPVDRWNLEDYYSADPEKPNTTASKWGGFIDDADKFDAAFFNISRREAEHMDPQQRLMLELTWTCIEDAGYAPLSLSGKDIGVFVGACNFDYDELQEQQSKSIEGHIATGTYTCIIPNRISYFFDFHGPSVPIDTACSSSLVALHQAVHALERGECEMALVGGISILCSPTYYVAFSQLGMLSPQGQCRTFDNKADGYVRGEGAGILLLKPLDKAIHDQDHIYGVIRGSATNHGGKARTLTSPNVYAQSKVVRSAYMRAGISPNTVTFIETHGTGTPLGDPIEINGLKRAFNQLHEAHNVPLPSTPYCALGAVKTNIGHLEAAAGIAGVIKILLALQHKKLPKLSNFQTQNQRLKLEGSVFHLLTETQEWMAVEGENGQTIPRRAGVSSFGFGGVNAHVVLEEAPEVVHKKRDAQAEPSHYLLTLSAKSEPSLRVLVSQYKDYISHSNNNLGDICFSTHTSRTHLDHRLALVASTSDQIAQQLSSWQKQPVNKVSQATKRVAVLFTGQGAQYVNMARELYQTQPIFKQTLDRCNESLNAYLDQPLLEVLYRDEEIEQGNRVLSQTAYTQPALFATEYALYQLWRSWGIKPSVVMGHSIGEIVAACVAGVFSLEDGLKLSAMRGKLMQQLPAGGAMVSAIASVERVKACIGGEDGVAIAAINGPQSTVFSGVASAVQSVAQHLDIQGIKTKALQVSHAFHSPLMQPMLAEFKQVVEQIHYSSPQLKLISNVTGQMVHDEVTTPDYWCQHILAPVNFAAGMECLQQEKIDIFLECGPRPILLGMGRQCLPEEDGADKAWLPSLRPGNNDWRQMLSTVGELYVRGVNIDWEGFHQDYAQYRKISLPTYPFQRQRYWVDGSSPRHQGIQGHDTQAATAALHAGANPLNPEPTEPQTIHVSTIWQDLKDADPLDRLPQLIQYLQEELARVLERDLIEELPDPEAGFVSLGIDSLMAMDLKRRVEANLHCKLSPTLAFNYPTIRAVAIYLIQHVLVFDTSPSPSWIQAEMLGSSSQSLSQSRTLARSWAMDLDSFFQLTSPSITPEQIQEISDAEAEDLLLKSLETLSF